jgi:hypothetical protein
MKWLLVVIVANTTPVKTDLIFSTYEACLAAETQMRKEQIDLVNRAMHSISKDEAEDVRKTKVDFWSRQVNWGTCIPSK